MASDAVWAEAERRYPESEPAYADRGLVSPEVQSRREAFEDGWEAATQAAEERVAALESELEGYHAATYETVTGDLLYDNTSGQPCPSCGRTPLPCGPCTIAGDPQTHDPCLGHIDGAWSACCGHGQTIGHVIMGEELPRALSASNEEGR